MMSFTVFIPLLTSILATASFAALPPNLTFDVNASSTRWLEAPAPGSKPTILTIYRSPEIYKSVQATLTVRKDLTSGETFNLQKYSRKWMSEYPRFGYKVLASHSFTQNGLDGFLIDLKAQDPNKLLRQVIFFRDPEAVIFTCTDHKDRFKVSLTACMSIIQTFHWKESVSDPSHIRRN